MKLSEQQIEDVFMVFHKQLLSTDFKFIKRQHSLESGNRIDLLFEDGEGKKVVVELKKSAVTREDIGQVLEYAGELRNSRVVLAAPYFATQVKRSFEHYGIDYLEFDLNEIQKLYKELPNDLSDFSRVKKDIHLPQNVVTTPLNSRPPKDGNIAFKVTYVDKLWCGVCSDKLYQENCFGKFKKTFCALQASNKVSCRSEVYSDLTEKIIAGKEYMAPCYDSTALTGVFSPAVSHGPVNDGLPHRCLEAKVGKLALFTSREPGTAEDSRFVFMIAPIARIDILQDKTEEFVCDINQAVLFVNLKELLDVSDRPKFWDFYRNKNNPERIAWNTGLFRYMNDRICHNVLAETVNGKYKVSNESLANAKKLLEIVG